MACTGVMLLTLLCWFLLCYSSFTLGLYLLYSIPGQTCSPPVHQGHGSVSHTICNSLGCLRIPVQLLGTLQLLR